MLATCTASCPTTQSEHLRSDAWTAVLAGGLAHALLTGLRAYLSVMAICVPAPAEVKRMVMAVKGGWRGQLAEIMLRGELVSWLGAG